jgi:hypothetical protein
VKHYGEVSLNLTGIFLYTIFPILGWQTIQKSNSENRGEKDQIELL